ncbi:MAG: aminotransferase class III-fold pyridoxal phosphate-dependent enzyme, partial [Halioglobus sp.]|nr:aminotransferase class III-fold pyridoxal phosphate-dependent enzyme [Halioglobus sp.]
MPADSQTLKELDRAHHLHPFTDYKDYSARGGRIVSRAEHIYIFDSDGNRMLDGMSGLWCCNLGYSQQGIVDAVTRQLQELPYYNSFFQCSNQPAVELAAQLVAVAPEGFSRVFFTTSGSEANDTNLRLVHRYYDCLGKPHKKHIISRKNAYHGSTIAA